jgi:protein phosphatase 2C family protein 2/3
LSSDHKPYNEGEKSRITAAGGFVDFGRVNGNLALSRAIGDFEFKKSAKLAPERQIVTAYPDVVIHDISEDDEFLVFACDGIWDCQSSQAVVEFVRRGIVAKQELDRICENLMDNCLASNSDTGGVGCDNMTMIIVGLLRGRTKEQWYDEVARRAASGDGPCAPPEYAELRGPESGSHDSRKSSGENSDEWFPKTAESSSGRVILLGDGLGVLTDADVEMPDHVEEDKDLASQVARGPAGNASNESKQAPTPHATGSSGSESDTTGQQHTENVPVSVETGSIPDKLPSPATTGGAADGPLSTVPSLRQIPPQPAQASVSDDQEEL